MRQLEHAQAVAMMKWVRMSVRKYPELKRLYHVPNGGARHRAVAAKMKAEGVRAGVLDYCLPVARGGFHGLYLELKAGKGRPTPSQKDEVDALVADGYRAEVRTGWEDSVKLLVEYLESGPTIVQKEEQASG